MNNKVNKSDQPKLNHTMIVAAAVKIADEDGIDSVSMRNVGSKLGVKAMSLYHHVANKDALIADMVEHVAPEIDSPNSKIDWKEAMRKRAHTINNVLNTHPWAAQLFLSKVNDGPRMMKFTDSTIGYLLEAGFTAAQADHTWNIIDSYIYGFNVQQQNFPFQSSEYKKVAAEYLPYISKEELPYVRAMTESIMNGWHDGIQDFDFGLNLILEAIERKYEIAG